MAIPAQKSLMDIEGMKEIAPKKPEPAKIKIVKIRGPSLLSGICTAKR
jgi:hypothetical protein